MRVPLRRIRSNSWHAREKVSGPEAVATNKEQLLARLREGERAGDNGLTIFNRWARLGKKEHKWFAKKLNFLRLIKNDQMQGARSSEE